MHSHKTTSMKKKLLHRGHTVISCDLKFNPARDYISPKRNSISSHDHFLTIDREKPPAKPQAFDKCFFCTGYPGKRGTRLRTVGDYAKWQTHPHAILSPHHHHLSIAYFLILLSSVVRVICSSLAASLLLPPVCARVCSMASFSTSCRDLPAIP